VVDGASQTQHADLSNYSWLPHCNDLFQTPIVARFSDSPRTRQAIDQRPVNNGFLQQSAIRYQQMPTIHGSQVDAIRILLAG
jgi:hypothetical protein